jgi:hypothetical protein
MAGVERPHRGDQADPFAPRPGGLDGRSNLSESTDDFGHLSASPTPAVWTVGVVQAIIGDDEVIENLTADQGLGDDPRHIVGPDAAVPDGLRIDHDDRTMLALIETAGLVDSRPTPEPGPFQFLLEGVPQGLRAGWIARTSRVPRLPHVAANEHVMSKGWHGPRFHRIVLMSFVHLGEPILNYGLPRLN